MVVTAGGHGKAPPVVFAPTLPAGAAPFGCATLTPATDFHPHPI